MKDLLIKLDACQEAREWAADKTWEEVYNTCERGDWLLWLFFRTNPDDLQLLTLAKGHIANTVRHLMKDNRSVKAVYLAIAFGEGKATREELDNASSSSADASAAYNAAADAVFAAYVADDVTTYAAYTAAFADASAAFAASDASDASAAFAASDATIYSSFAASDDTTYAAFAAARKDSLKQSADIVRKYIPIELWNVNK